MLTVAGYSGDAGDALASPSFPPFVANGMMFTTFDNDNDNWAGGLCAGKGGWWYCSSSSSGSDSSDGGGGGSSSSI